MSTNGGNGNEGLGIETKKIGYGCGGDGGEARDAHLGGVGEHRDILDEMIRLGMAFDKKMKELIDEYRSTWTFGSVSALNLHEQLTTIRHALYPIPRMNSHNDATRNA